MKNFRKLSRQDLKKISGGKVPAQPIDGGSCVAHINCSSGKGIWISETSVSWCP